MDGKAVLVTTEHRGVFFGYLVRQTDKTVELGEVVGDEEKMGALKREIIAEC